jgi:hypothetical protein
MSRRVLFAAAMLPLLAGIALAGPEKIDFPADYRTRFKLYNEIERPDRKPPQVRFMYVNPEAAAAAQAGRPVPDGTILIMEDRRVRMDATGQPERGPDGRFIATDEVANVFVQQKRAGWGAEYPPERRNGDWEYAWFNADGSRKADAKFDGCFSCHLNRPDRDFNFTFSKWVSDGKP